MAISKITSDAIDATDFNLDSNTLTIDATNNRVGIGTSPSVKLDIDNGSLKVNRGNSSGDIAVFRGLNAEKVKIDTDGIKFNGDTAAANALDDYEEGTWTPAGSANVDAIGSQSAFYTKIGNKVTVSFYANINPTNNTQTIQLSGLPFAVTDKIVGTQVEATGVAFEDNSLFLIWAQGGTSQVNIEFDRPMEGSASTAAKDYRASITYFSD
jgi:hypothetical protein